MMHDVIVEGHRVLKFGFYSNTILRDPNYVSVYHNTETSFHIKRDHTGDTGCGYLVPWLEEMLLQYLSYVHINEGTVYWAHQ